jgi:hypothetical protein
MPSSGVQTLLEESRSDAILLYDSCRCADTAITKSTLHGITELIAACGFQTTAPGVGTTSFTHALTYVLRLSTMAGSRFSVSELFARVLAQLRNARGRTNQTTPVHATLTCEDSGRKIMLEPTHVSILRMRVACSMPVGT